MEHVLFERKQRDALSTSRLLKGNCVLQEKKTKGLEPRKRRGKGAVGRGRAGEGRRRRKEAKEAD